MPKRTRYCAIGSWPNYPDVADSLQTCSGKFSFPPSPEERGDRSANPAFRHRGDSANLAKLPLKWALLFFAFLLIFERKYD